MLPDWLKQLAAECPDDDRRQLEKTMGEWQCNKCGKDTKCPECRRCENCDDSYHSRVMKEMVDRYEADLSELRKENSMLVQVISNRRVSMAEEPPPFFDDEMPF